MIFFILYVLMCILWAVFCVRVQHTNGRYPAKDIWVIGLNFLFAPFSLILGITRIPRDFGGHKILFSTLNFMSNNVNILASKEEATNFAVDENKKSENHPAFYLSGRRL